MAENNKKAAAKVQVTKAEKATIAKKNKAAKKMAKRNLSSGIIHVHSTSNNTIVTLTDDSGKALAWSSSGAIGFKGSKKSTPFAAGIAAETVGKKALEFGIKTVKVQAKGTGAGKDTAIRSLETVGIRVTEIKDVTTVPHNGCRPPKKRR